MDYIIRNMCEDEWHLLEEFLFQAIYVPEGFEGGAALDFASALWCWLIYHLTVSLKWIGAIGAGLLALAMCAVNFARIRKMR